MWWNKTNTNTNTNDGGDEESTVGLSSTENKGKGSGYGKRYPSQQSMFSSASTDFGVGADKNNDNFLLWRNVTVSMKSGGRILLKDAWGEAPSRQVTAVMGPSGAGKTTLLNALAGRIRSNANLTVQSELFVGNQALKAPTHSNMDYRRRVAFVAQDDTLVPTATPRECLRFSARLRLSREVSDDQVEQEVTTMLGALGLTGCADVPVGGPLVKGLSGGERKRTSVGVELVVRPSIIFLDEPTSGLDSFSALQVVRALRNVASGGNGAAVLCTIHQPSSAVYASFDSVCFLVGGRVLYGGPAGPESARLFAAMGGGRPAYKCPAHHNPCDWIIHVSQSTSEETLEAEGFFTGPPPSSSSSKDTPHKAPSQANTVTSTAMVTHQYKLDDSKSTTGAHWTLQVRMLLQREGQNTRRNRLVTFAKLALSITISSMVSLMFFNVGRTENSELIHFQSHLGALMMALILSMCGTALPVMLTFPEERPVFLREYSTNHFSVFSYFLSVVWVEALWTFVQVVSVCLLTYWAIGFHMSFVEYLCVSYGIAMATTAIAALLGAISSDAKVAVQLLPVVFLPQLLLCGFLVSPSLISPLLVWCTYLCPLTYALRLAILAEFRDCQKLTCSLIVNGMEAEADDVWWYWICLTAFFIISKALALAVLQRKATKFF